jgi:hypothetical protein
MSRVGTGDAIGFVDVPCAEGEMEVPVSGDLSELFDTDVAHASLILL